jgi:hypothetical protein
VADKDSMERKVFLLPSELVARLRQYQADSGIVSEVEVVRRLLDSALQMRDTIQTIMEKLKARYAEEKDLRVLASDVLTRHPLVTNVSFGDSEMTFSLQDKFRGRIDWKGDLYIGYPDSGYDDWTTYENYLRSIQPKSAAPKSPARAVGGWDSRPSNDMDDEIPF